jgi:hypothetical protein
MFRERYTGLRLQKKSHGSEKPVFELLDGRSGLLRWEGHRFWTMEVRSWLEVWRSSLLLLPSLLVLYTKALSSVR